MLLDVCMRPGYATVFCFGNLDIFEIRKKVELKNTILVIQNVKFVLHKLMIISKE